MWFFQKIWPVITIVAILTFVGEQTGYYLVSDLWWWVFPAASTVIWFNILMHILVVGAAHIMHRTNNKEAFVKVILDNVPKNIGIVMNMALLFWLQFYWAAAIMVVLYFPIWYIRYKYYDLEIQSYER